MKHRFFHENHDLVLLGGDELIRLAHHPKKHSHYGDSPKTKFSSFEHYGIKLGEQKNGEHQWELLVGTHREHGGNIKFSPPPTLGSNDTYFNTCLLTPCHGFGHAKPTRVFDPHDGDAN
jgi:hypothetical protein